LLTVSELLRGLDVRLLTGEAAIEAPVRWVHISELLDPTPWLSGGEVLLTTGMALQDASEQRDFILRLADHGLAGLGFGIGFGHHEVPPELLAAAAERDFPVFAVPYELPFLAVTEAAFTQLVNEQYAVLRRALAAHERLERVVLAERGLEALAATLATLIGGAVLVFDSRGEPLVKRAFRRPPAQEEVAALASELAQRRHLARTFLPSAPALADRSLALPVAADGVPAGAMSRAGNGNGNGNAQLVERVPEAWLVAIKDGGPLSDFDRLTLHQAVTIVALELLRSRVAGDTERRLAGDVLAALVAGELTGADLTRRLEPFGLASCAAAIVCRPGEGRGSAGAMEDALLCAMREEAAPGLVASQAGVTCALVAAGAELELFDLAERIARRLSANLQARIEVGVGRPMPAADARRTFQEARCALESLTFRAEANNGNGHGGTSTQNGSPTRPRVATYKDLGSFQLLLSLQDDEALRLFCDSILGPIEASEGHYGGELMRSLEAFIEENGQWERAAKRLYCHRHTLRYRIRRVEELTGRNLSSARDRIEFWLALRGRELVA
jgi:purine catabolism regulator